MALRLYRRHVKNCSGEDCSCPIWIYGHTANGTLYPRQSTRTTDMRIAEATLARIERESLSDTRLGKTVESCVEAYLRSNGGLSENTLKRQRLYLKRFLSWCHASGIYHINELSMDAIQSYGDSLDMKPSSISIVISTARAFLRECYRREWLSYDLAGRMRPVPTTFEDPVPFSGDELSRIFSAVSNIGKRTRGFSSRPDALRLLFRVMLEAGLRISDALLFDPRKMQRGEFLWVYSFVPYKTRRKRGIVDAYIGDDLARELLGMEWMSDSHPFIYGGKPVSSMRWRVYQLMQSIGERVGVNNCHPHRFRHTFAVNCLLRGLTVEQVSRALGHASIAITEKHYAPWVKARRALLERAFAKSLNLGGGDQCLTPPNDARAVAEPSPNGTRVDPQLVGNISDTVVLLH